MVIFWERIKISILLLDFNLLLFYLRTHIFRSHYWKKNNSQEFLITPSIITNDTGDLMAQQEKYKSELYSSIEKIPDEILPYLGERIFDR